MLPMRHSTSSGSLFSLDVWDFGENAMKCSSRDIGGDLSHPFHENRLYLGIVISETISHVKVPFF